MWECPCCDRCFNSSGARVQHMDAKDHWLECRVCGCEFDTEHGRRDHEAKKHWHCGDCNRDFSSLNNITMHLRSKMHNSIVCCFCRQSFGTATGIVHHLEKGSCPKARGLNRDQIYRIVRSKDPKGIISKNLIGWQGSSEYEIAYPSKAWNGRAYECYLCDREFGSTKALGQHLSSPAHQEDLYHCPNADCRRDFKALASLINHLESESCGYIRFKNVQNKVTDIISSKRRLRF